MSHPPAHRIDLQPGRAIDLGPVSLADSAMKHRLTLRIEENSKASLIASMDGRIDGTTVEAFEGFGTQMCADYEGRAIILDIEKLTYISSAGLRAMLVLAKASGRRSIAFKLCKPIEPVMEVFMIAGLDKIIGLHETRRAALRASGKP